VVEQGRQALQRGDEFAGVVGAFGVVDQQPCPPPVGVVADVVNTNVGGGLVVDASSLTAVLYE
jgi:N-acetylmuramic acid 6-phosphate (MurNAc-6-P) etherase